MRFLTSLHFALQGLKQAIKQEKNFRIHVIAALLAVVSGFAFQLNWQEWLWIFLSITLVFAAELFNTALESLTNLVSPAYHDLAKITKDTAAAAVLVTALFAFVSGIIIFFPKIVTLIESL